MIMQILRNQAKKRPGLDFCDFRLERNSSEKPTFAPKSASSSNFGVLETAKLERALTRTSSRCHRGNIWRRLSDILALCPRIPSAKTPLFGSRSPTHTLLRERPGANPCISDRKNRHRMIKKLCRYERLDAISQLFLW